MFKESNKKVLGDTWEKIREGYCKIKLTKLMSQVSKNFFGDSNPKNFRRNSKILFYVRGLKDKLSKNSLSFTRI